MDFEQELIRVADKYKAQGYQVVLHPGPDNLPLFAKNFKVEIVGQRGTEGVLVTVKKNREELQADAEAPRYADVTASHTGWRFDFVILEAEPQMARELRGAQELSDEHFHQLLYYVRELVGKPYMNLAFITAWAALEAAMRRRLRAAGEKAGWGTPPRQMLNELYSAGIFSREEFTRLEFASRVRNEIVHGFVTSPEVKADFVQFLVDITIRLLEESQKTKQPA
jgi:hypothetical protein